MDGGYTSAFATAPVNLSISGAERCAGMFAMTSYRVQA